jgi:prephenate dehydrogenase
MQAAIIGVDGGMGQWLSKHLKSLGYSVAGFDERRGDDPSTLSDADLVVVSVPISVTAETIRKTLKHLEHGALLMEIASLKSGIHEAMIEAASQGVDVLSVHPMFGPSIDSLAGKTVAVVPVVDAEHEMENASRFFPGAQIEVVDAEEHDRLMSVILSLPYLINLAFAATLQDEDLPLLRRLSGTSFATQYALSQSIAAEKSNLCYSIIQDNKALKTSLDKFLNSLKEIKETDNLEEFESLHSEIKEALEKDPLHNNVNDIRQRVFELIKTK